MDETDSDQFYIKDELEICDEHSEQGDFNQFYIKDKLETSDIIENFSTSGAIVEKIVLCETPVKCGEVFVGYCSNFTLVCSICRDEFESFDSFGAHIKERHLELKPETEVHIEQHIFADPLPVCDDVNRQHFSNGEEAADNLRTNKNPAWTQSTINDNLQTNQHENTGTKQINDIGEAKEKLEEEKSDKGITPGKRVGTKRRTADSRKDYFCVYCGAAFVTRRSFVAHSKEKHNIIPAEHAGDVNMPLSEPVKMTCKYCCKTFDAQIDFKNHMPIHTGRYRFLCPFCPKKFKETYSRDMHVNTHTGERPFKCTHCPKAFSHSCNLEMHIRMHLGIKKFSCDYCNKRFVQSSEKKVHERTHTDERAFQCEECGERFITHSQLRNHKKRHTNIRNYKCEVCSKAFFDSSSLKNHMTTHSGERPYVCNICSRTYPHKKGLRRHQNGHKEKTKSD